MRLRLIMNNKRLSIYNHTIKNYELFLNKFAWFWIKCLKIFPLKLFKRSSNEQMMTRNILCRFDLQVDRNGMQCMIGTTMTSTISLIWYIVEAQNVYTVTDSTNDLAISYKANMKRERRRLLVQPNRNRILKMPGVNDTRIPKRQKFT